MKKMFSRMSALLMMATFPIFLFAATASAAPIIGEIHFEGSLQLTEGVGDALSFETAEGVKFDDVTVKLSTGDFAGLNGTTAIYEDFNFDPFTGPVTPLWTAGAFSFDLETVNVHLHPVGTGTILAVEGMGTLMSDGFDDTKGAWILTTQTLSGMTEITFSAVSVPVPVPEPGTLLLLGSGMAGLALSRRRSMSK